MTVMIRKKLTKPELAFCHKTLSSDALAALTLHHLAVGEPMSVVRFADGEHAVMEAGLYGRPSGCTTDAHWLGKYGMDGADMKAVAIDLKEAAHKATYVAPSISGLYMRNYDLYEHMIDRTYYVDTFYMYFWRSAGRLDEILKAVKSIHMLNRDWQKLAPTLQTKYNLTCKLSGFALNSWRDRDQALQSAIESKAELVLVSGGPSGKILPTRITAQRPCVALDVGCAIEAWIQ